MTPQPVPASSDPSRTERLVTPGLAAFLAVVAALVGAGLWQREWRPDLSRAIELLADGDLDGKARAAMLSRVVLLSRDAEGLRERWAGVLAALAIGDRDAFAAARARLPADVPPVPAAAERRFLDLGDPMVENVLTAFAAEAANDRAAAHRSWQQVAAQALLSRRPFAGEIAAAGAARTA